MGDETAISWADKTFNPWIGCTRISPACDGCYAAGLMGTAGRFGPARALWGGPGKGEGTRDRTAASTWAKVRTWNRQAAAHPGQTFVFCASLADVFDNAVDPIWRRDLFDLIRATPNLTYLLLTKRPGMIVKLFEQAVGLGKDRDHEPTPEEAWPRNAAIGCTVVNQEEADRDIPKLLAAKAALSPAFAFLSMEPLLGPVDVSKFMWPVHARWPAPYRSPGEARAAGAEVTYHRQALVWAGASFVDWVITGGETDQKLEDGSTHMARPADPAWFRSLREQCAVAGVPFHFKQWGEWQPAHPDAGQVRLGLSDLARLGKDHDPGTLDGVMHHARPEARP